MGRESEAVVSELRARGASWVVQSPVFPLLINLPGSWLWLHAHAAPDGFWPWGGDAERSARIPLGRTHSTALSVSSQLYH